MGLVVAASRRLCSTVGIDEEVVKEYIRNQEKEEERLEQLELDYGKDPL